MACQGPRMIRLGCFSQVRFQLGGGLLDQSQVRTVRREVEQARVCRPDQLAHDLSLVAGQVTHDHDVPGFRLGDEHSADIGFEGVEAGRPSRTVHRAPWSGSCRHDAARR